MNARQKAKKYKRMYEALLNSPVKFNVEQYKIDTLRCEKFYPAAPIVLGDSNYVRKIVVKDIAESLASNLDKYIDYFTEFCQYTNQYRFYGEIKVVSRK